MDVKAPRNHKRTVPAAKEKGSSTDVENSKPSRKSKTTPLPALVAGKEVLDRALSIFKNSNKNPIWVRGTVKGFDPTTARHKICYDLPLPEAQVEEEEWLCLGKSMFMWADEEHVCPVANPTFSLKHTPSNEAAVGKRVKVFWTAMGKWYQGKVVDYDASSGRHRVSFRDGDEKRCLLRQEALVWLDIPELGSEAAIRKMRADEGEQAAAPPSRGGSSPAQAAEDGAQGSSSGIKAVTIDAMKSPLKSPAKSSLKSPAASKRKSRGSASKEQPDVQSQRRRTMKAAEERSQKGASKPGAAEQPSSSGKSSSEAHTAASGSREAPVTSCGAEANARRGNGHPAEDSKSGSSSSHEADVEPQKSPLKSPLKSPTKKQKPASPPAAKLASPGPALPNGSGLAAAHAVAPDAPPKACKGHDDASRKRSRLGLPALAVTQQQAAADPAAPEAKRRPPPRPSKPPSKPGRKLRRIGEEQRAPGVRRQKSAGDVEFEAACQAVVGARVGVWWEDDRCYYKGAIVSHDWYHKRLKVLYDDGVEEFISPQKEETRYMWLTPRARTAGATDDIHAAFALLRATNAVLPAGEPAAAVRHSSAPPAMASVTAVGGTADGSHLDALVPLRPPSAAGKIDEAKQPGSGHQVYPHPVDSTTRAQLAQPKAGAVMLSVSTPAAWPAPLRSLSGTPASTNGTPLTGLQTMVPPSGLHLSTQKPLQPTAQPVGCPVASHGDPRFAPTPEGGAKPDGRLATVQAPLGHAAEGWKVSMVFRGNHHIFQGRVLVYDARAARHHVLWEDGEDEWVDAAREPLSWHADRPKTAGISAGLPAGQVPPKGDDLVGWRIAVYWKDEKQFYGGTVEDYDAELDQHTVSYSDGDELCESLCGQVFKFVLPPTVQPVGARRATRGQARADSSEREDGDRRPRRRQRLAPPADDSDADDDDSDGDWGRGREPEQRRPTGRLPAQLHRETSTPAVATPRTCDIRRLNSKVGSLLLYEGEDNHIDATPGNSPTFSPRANLSAGTVPDAHDPRGQPALDRRITGLKSARGFRVAVKRVRVFLPGASGAKQAGASGESRPAMLAETTTRLSGVTPCQDSLRQMLRRVNAAQHSIETGLPGTMLVSKPELGVGSEQPFAPRPQQIAREAADEDDDSSPELIDVPIVKAEEDALPAAAQPCPAEGTAAFDPSASPPRGPDQEEQTTPPPSPFATFASKDAPPPDLILALALDPCPEFGDTAVPAVKCCRTDASRAVPVFANGSLSLPQTPSALSEGGLLGPSRAGSIISAPLAAEIARLKSGISDGARPGSGKASG